LGLTTTAKNSGKKRLQPPFKAITEAQAQWTILDVQGPMISGFYLQSASYVGLYPGPAMAFSMQYFAISRKVIRTHLAKGLVGRLSIFISLRIYSY